MALEKSIALESGVIVNYHRIVSINSVINHETVIEIASYTDSTKRNEEKEKLAKNEPMDVFIHTNYKCVDYDKDLNIEAAYEFLKDLDEFDGAKNV